MNHKDQKWVMRSDIVDTEPSPGLVRSVLAYCDSIMGVENRFEKGASGPMHSHPHIQFTYILSGKFEFTIGDEIKTVSTGDTLLMPKDIIHGNVCLETGAMLDVFTPMREDFV